MGMPFGKMGRRGFTLVELMVVVAIIAILATIATPNLFGFLKRTRARDGANAVASYIQNARDQAMARGEVVLVRIQVVNGQPKVETFRAPAVSDFDDGTSLEESAGQDGTGGTRTRNRYASVCSELGDPATVFTITNRVAVLNPTAAVTNQEVAEPLDPNVRVVGMSSVATGDVVGTGTGTSTVDLCFAPNGRLYTSAGAPMQTQVGECDEALVVVLTSDPNIGPTPSLEQVSSVGGNVGQINNWVCPATLPASPADRKLLFTQLDAVRDSYFVYSISVSFNGAVRVD